MRAVAIVLSLLACAQLASAQVVVGTVVDQANAPVRGAFVLLLDARARQVAGALTDARGAFVFRTAPGAYTVRADQIGHRSAATPAFTLQPGQTHTVRLALEVNAVRLKEIDVRGENRCVGQSEQSKLTAQVWEEARKALTVWAWVEKNERAAFQTRAYEIDLDRSLRPLGPAAYTFQASQGKQAYHAEDPDTLARYGYVRALKGETYVYGLDATVLLSTVFVAQHCFRLQRDANRKGLIGLAFEPIRGRRLPDVRGTLWLDETTAHLRFVEYGYTGIEEEGWGDARYAGGRTEFERLENGAWIVRRWYVRSPRYERSRPTQPLRLAGAREEGSEIVSVQVVGGQKASLVEKVSIDGFVLDSISGRPLEGATIYLSGTAHSTISGLAGSFRLDSIPSGLYAISFMHPRVDSLPLYPKPILLDLKPPGATVKLGTPSVTSALIEACPPSVLDENRAISRDTTFSNRGVLFGNLLTPASEHRPLMLEARWRRFNLKRNVAEELSWSGSGLGAKPGPDGRYIFCGLPIDHPVEIVVRVGTDIVQRDTVRLLSPGFKRLDYRVRQ